MIFPDSIEVAAGLVFVYLLVSVITTIARESLEGFVKSRGRMLERGIVEMLGRQHAKGAHKYEMVTQFYTHPLIQSLYQGDYTSPVKRKFQASSRLPSYISSSYFAYALLDIVAEKGGYSTFEGRDVQNLLDASEQLEDARLKKVVQFALTSSGGDFTLAHRQIEDWYNAAMVRVSGWYRRDTHKIVFWSGLAAAIILNVNTFVIADSLYRDPTLRKVAVAKAEAYIAHSRVETEPAPVVVEAAPQTGANAEGAADVAILAKPAMVAALPDPAGKAKMDQAWNTLATEKDYIDELGLPLGWNDNTLTVMQRFFNIAVPEEKSVKTVPDKTPVKPVKATGIRGWFDGQAHYLMTLLDVRTDADAMLVFGGNFLRNTIGILTIILGWVMTALAITLGAPFWFDILNRLMVIRSTQKPKDASSTGPANLASLFTAPDPSGPTPGAPALSYVAVPSPSSSPLTTPRLSSRPEDQALIASIDPRDRPREED